MPPKTLAAQYDPKNPQKVQEALASIAGIIDDPIARVKIEVEVVSTYVWNITMTVVDRRSAPYSPHLFLSQDKMKVGRWIVAWHVTANDIDGDPEAVAPDFSIPAGTGKMLDATSDFYRTRTNEDGVIICQLQKPTAPIIHAAVIGLELIQKFDEDTGLPLAVE